MKKIRAAAVQFNHFPGDKGKNIGVMRGFIRRAAEKDVDLLVFPEMCITGYWHVRKLSREQILELSEPVPEGPSTAFLIESARETGMTIGAGFIQRGNDDSLYNAYVVAMPDGSYAVHRKLHMFISEHMKSGDEYTVFDIPQGCRVGVLICYDNNIIENARINALEGAEILLAPHQTGGCKSRSPHAMKPIAPALWMNRHANPEAVRREFMGANGREWLMRWLPSRAHDNGLFLVFSNGVGVDDDEVRTGNAMILDPYGRVLVESTSIEDDMVVADLDSALREKCTGSRWLTARRPELYGKLVEPTGRERNTRNVRFDIRED